MQIFILDLDIKKCAEYHCDKHVISAIKEHCQMLSTCHSHYKSWEKDIMLMPCYQNHPCNVWLRKSLSNYRWLVRLTHELCMEFFKRYGHHHSYLGLTEIFLLQEPKMEDIGLTPFALAIPEEYKSPYQEILNFDYYVSCYRQYYMGEKSMIAKWKHSPHPEWYPEELLSHVVVDKDVDYKVYIMESLKLNK